jgi:hypothetical protein
MAERAPATAEGAGTKAASTQPQRAAVSQTMSTEAMLMI